MDKKTTVAVADPVSWNRGTLICQGFKIKRRKTSACGIGTLKATRLFQLLVAV
jgi:hypothetical protein